MLTQFKHFAAMVFLLSVPSLATASGEADTQALVVESRSVSGQRPDQGVIPIAGDCQPTWTPDLFFPAPPGMDGSVHALAVFDDGSGAGPALYAGGNFTTAGGVAANNIAKWDGSSWSAVGTGTNSYVLALTVFDDGSGDGPALYAGGDFTNAGGVSANRIAKWDGASWSTLGAGIGDDSIAPSVGALTVFDDGSGGGPALYAGGFFSTAGGGAADYIAKWDGSSWSAVGTGMNSFVLALTVFDDGSGDGPALYAGGRFTTAGGVLASRVAKWDGASWSALGLGMVGGWVTVLTVFDDGSGSGPALYAGGEFFGAGGVPSSRIAKWDGSLWSPLGTGVTAASDSGFVVAVRALARFDDADDAPSLYAGGFFTSAGGAPSSFIARWTACAAVPTPCPGDTNGDNVVNFTDLNAVLADFGMSGTGHAGDSNGDGVVNFSDLNEVLAAFGTTCD